MRRLVPTRLVCQVPVETRVEGRSRSPNRSSSRKISRKKEPQKTWRELVGKGPIKQYQGGSSILLPAGKMEGEVIIFFLSGPKIEEVGSSFLKSRSLTKPCASSKNPLPIILEEIAISLSSSIRSSTYYSSKPKIEDFHDLRRRRSYKGVLRSSEPK